MIDYKVPDRRVPASIITMHDIGRLQRELATIQAFFANAAARKAGGSISLPATSTQLENIAKQYSCNLLQAQDRDRLDKELVHIRELARPVDVSFAGIPSPLFLQKIVTWFRNNVDMDIVLNVGHEPSIASGCVVRTPRKIYDLSLGRKFANQRQVLLDAIRQ